MTTALREYRQPLSADEIVFGKLELTCRKRDRQGTASQSEYGGLKVYRAAISKEDKISLLDVIGPTGEVMALRAALGTKIDSEFKFSDCGVGIREYRQPERDECGYRYYYENVGQKLGGRQLIHFIAVSNKAGFMPMVTSYALARCLASEKFNTPFLCPEIHGEGVPDWMPYLTQKFLEREVLQYLDSWNCNAGLLLPRQAEIENIVSEGVADGSLPWVDYDVKEIAAALADQRAAEGV